MDNITASRVALLHPVLQRRYNQFDQLMVADGINMRVVQGLRTYPEQNGLFAQGRTAPGPPCMHAGVTRPIGSCAEHPYGLVVTNARGGWSMHNFGLALDADPDIPGLSVWHPDYNTGDDRWKLMLDKATTCGLAEGASWRTFPDTPHFYLQEMASDPNDKMRELMQQGGIDAVWDWVNTSYSLT